MTPQQLKSSILQRAIEGRLVEQRAEEGTAGELIKEIRAEKEKMIKEGKIKKGRPLPPITEEEKPFDIPEGWEWVRLFEICWFIVDCPHSTPKYVEYKTDFVGIDTNCIDENGNIKQWRYVLQDAYEKRIARLIPKGGDIVLTREGSIGRAAILPTDMNICLGQRVMLLRPAKMDAKYLRWFIMSPDTLARLTTKQKGLGAKHINVSDIYKITIPLPPIAEQRRIVAKIEELLPLIDRYEKAYTKLTNFNTRFPEAMKKSLLQYAIQGKLVEQRQDEGTAEDLIKKIQAEKKRLIAEKKIKKTKALPPITEEEKPFDIPNGWEWVRLGELFTMQAGKNISAACISDVKDEEHKYLCYGGNGIRGYVAKYNHDGVYPLIGRQGALCGNVHLADGKFYATEHAVVTEIYAGTSEEWAKYFLIALDLNQYATATAQPGLAVNKIENVPIPLPPLAEQHRIVAKLEELLPFCEQLNKFAGKA